MFSYFYLSYLGESFVMPQFAPQIGQFVEKKTNYVLIFEDVRRNKKRTTFTFTGFSVVPSYVFFIHNNILP
jgi:hypothetical protein